MSKWLDQDTSGTPKLCSMIFGRPRYCYAINLFPPGVASFLCYSRITSATVPFCFGALPSGIQLSLFCGNSISNIFTCQQKPQVRSVLRATKADREAPLNQQKLLWVLCVFPVMDTHANRKNWDHYTPMKGQLTNYAELFIQLQNQKINHQLQRRTVSS